MNWHGHICRKIKINALSTSFISHMLSFYFYVQPPKCKFFFFCKHYFQCILGVSGEKIMTNQYTIVSGGIFLHIYTFHGKKREIKIWQSAVPTTKQDINWINYLHGNWNKIRSLLRAHIYLPLPQTTPATSCLAFIANSINPRENLSSGPDIFLKVRY